MRLEFFKMDFIATALFGKEYKGSLVREFDSDEKNSKDSKKAKIEKQEELLKKLRGMGIPIKVSQTSNVKRETKKIK
jgi:hypothetical protein